MLKVGLTGGIASGKTTVAGMLAVRGCRILDADRIAHQLMAPGQPAYEELVRVFGRGILDASGGVDRKRLGEIVFADAARRAELNRILHPRVIAEIEKEFVRLAAAEPEGIAGGGGAGAGSPQRPDKLIVPVCPREQQLERLIKMTGLASAQAEQRLAAQLPLEEKRRYADYEIDCSDALADTEPQGGEVGG